MRGSNAEYISRLDHLRFVAATLVVVYHSVRYEVGIWDVSNPLLTPVTEGHTGVALFMVVSGYIFTVIAGDREVRYLPFLRNRALRIYPLYVFAVLLALMQGGQEGSWVSPVLLPFLSSQLTNPLFGHLWTIAVELQFYLLFPVLLARARTGGRRQLVALIGLFAMVRLLVWASTGSVWELSYLTIWGRMDQFLIGVLLGLSATRIQARLRNPAWLVLAVGAVVALTTWMEGSGVLDSEVADPSSTWIVIPTIEGAVWGLFLVSYLACSVRIPALVDRSLAWLGRLSFSMYVMHLLVVIAISERIGLIDFGANRPVNALVQAVLVALPLTIAVSAVTFHSIERPFLRLRGRYLDQRAAAPVPPDDAAPEVAEATAPGMAAVTPAPLPSQA